MFRSSNGYERQLDLDRSCGFVRCECRTRIKANDLFSGWSLGRCCWIWAWCRQGALRIISSWGIARRTVKKRRCPGRDGSDSGGRPALAGVD